MKRIIFSIFTALLAVALLIPATAMAETESDPFVTDLLAGQDIDVGDVEVWDDGTDLHVKYVIEDLDWIITETHLYVGIGCPLTSAPGQFPYDDADASSISDTAVEYVIPLASISDYVMETNKKGKPTGNLLPGENVGVDPGDCVCIAAHAVVVSPVEGCWETVWQIGDVETADPSSGLLYNYADEFNWGPVGATPTASGPTLAVVEPPFTDPFIVGTTPTLEFPYNSNFVRDYATDFDVQWDGGLLFGGNLTISWSPGISASETKIVYDGIDSDSFSAVGASTPGQGWFENKYPLVEDTFAMGPVAYGTHTINFQHTQGDGTFWDWIRLEKPCEQWETAWGEGDPIDVNGNWSMCFCYCVSGTLWQIGTPDGNAGPVAGSAEFPVTGTVGDPGSWVWYASYDYYVGSDVDPIADPSAPGYIGTDNVREFVPVTDTRPPTDTTQELNIFFDLQCDYAANALTLYYDRYGSEVDTIRLDGDIIATVSATEGGWQQFQISFPAVEAGAHFLTIAYEGGGDNNGHYIDYLKLVN